MIILKKIFYIENIFKEEIVPDYNLKYQSIKKTFVKNLIISGNIKLPENFIKLIKKSKLNQIYPDQILKK